MGALGPRGASMILIAFLAGAAIGITFCICCDALMEVE
jgi:hypothetical protein